MDAPLLANELADSRGADVDYFKGLDEVAALQKLALAEEAIYSSDVLTDTERRIFVAVRVDGKSRAAVGRELDPPLTGQRVGQVAALAFIKIQRYVKRKEDRPGTAQGDETEGGATGGRR